MTTPKQLQSATPAPQKALTLSRKLDECKPLARGNPCLHFIIASPDIVLHQHSSRNVRGVPRVQADWRQGLTVVHFSAQPEPLLTQNTPYVPHDTS